MGNVSAIGTGRPALAPAFDSIIRKYLRIALRWRWPIAGAIMVCLLLGLIATFLATPMYTASATVEITRDSNKVTDFQGVERETSVGDQEFYQTQYGLLAARSLAERVATKLRLADDPRFFEMFIGASERPEFQLANGRYPLKGRDVRQKLAARILLGSISVEPTRLSRLVDILFTSPDPEFSAKVANAWAEGYIESNLDRKVQATSYGREQLQRQLAQYKERLDQSQRQLVEYASTQQIINLPAQNGGDGKVTQERSIVADNLASLNAALSQATADRIAAEARYRSGGKGGASTQALGNQAINLLRNRRAELAAQYQELMVRFEPGYPAAQALKSQIDQLDRAISREEGRVTEAIGGDFREAASREAELRSRVEALKAEYLDLRRRSIQYNIFQQEVDTNRALYDGLLQRFKEIGVAGGIGMNNVAIVDRAEVPSGPSSPNLTINLLLSLLVGLALGAGIAILLEQLDDRIVDPAEVERRLGIPLIGTVPRLTDGKPIEAILDRKSAMVEAYMAVQTSLGFTTDHGVPKSFAITSTRPAEGKSSTALALAVTLSRGGRKVALIDGDMRSPSLHELLGINHDFGLSNYLAGDDGIDSLIISAGELGFDAITAGPLPPNAAELLTGPRLGELIATLLKRYDHVLVDSPPVMGLADAPLIAANVEGIVFAVESHGIRQEQVRTALERLASSHARILGAVLTKFDSQRAHYGYGYEYGYGYGRETEIVGKA